MIDVRVLKDLVETWNAKKTTGREFTQKDMRHFIEVMNYHTRQLVAQFQIHDPEFWVGLQELAAHASTLTTKGAKVFGDGIDRTNV